MKLGLSYNLFDGEELLKSSILSVRDSCDHISVIYQKVSYFGNPCSSRVLDLLSDLQKESLVDQIHLFEPDFKLAAGQNEINKRNLGLNLARKNRCSHFLTIDTDEFYEREQFRRAKEHVEKNRVEISACHFLNYIKEPVYQLEGLSFYCVPFISKIKLFSKFNPRNQYPVLVDPSRKLKGSRFKYFEPEELLMHHMTYVRNSFEAKFNNSSGKDTFAKSGVAEAIKTWQYPGDWIDPTIHFVDAKANNVFKVKKVPNRFNINLGDFNKA